MKIAFLVLAHKNPLQLSKLFKSLEHKNTGIFLHLDKRTNKKEFVEAFNKKNIKLECLNQKTKIIYSSYTYIQATLSLILDAYSKGYDYYILISGQDFPLKPIEHIYNQILDNKTMSYLDYNTIPYIKLAYNGKMRVNYFNFLVNKKMETLFPWQEISHKMSIKGKLLNLYLWLKNGLKTKRNFPLKMQAYYSSQWWNFSKEAISYILDFLKTNPTYISYHKNALHPEEMFFQSILLNSNLKNKIINNNLRHIEWEEGNKHPNTLDFKKIKNIDSKINIFARKFELNLDK